jgi:hypothetical protein
MPACRQAGNPQYSYELGVHPFGGFLKHKKANYKKLSEYNDILRKIIKHIKKWW